MMKYPVSNPLKVAIAKLFDSPEAPLSCLGALEDMSAKDFQESLSPNVSPTQRVRMLQKRLEDYVALNAAQVDELGPEEAARLRAESTATLIALRELWLHFPEAFNQSAK